MFAFLVGKGTPRHATIDCARSLGADEAVRAQAALLAVPGVVVARVLSVAGVIHVGFRPGATAVPALRDVVAALGIPVRSVAEDRGAVPAGRDTCC